MNRPNVSLFYVIIQRQQSKHKTQTHSRIYIEQNMYIKKEGSMRNTHTHIDSDLFQLNFRAGEGRRRGTLQKRRDAYI